MTNKDIDEILSNFQTWDMCGSRSCENFNNFKRAKQKLDEAYGKQFLELVGEDEYIDSRHETNGEGAYEWSYNIKAVARNEFRTNLRDQLRQAIKDKYLGGQNEAYNK